MSNGIDPSPTLDLSDIDEIEAAIPGLDLRIRRLTNRDGPVLMRTAELEDVSLLVGEMRFPIVSAGGIDDETLVVAVPLDEVPGTWDGRPFAVDRAWFYGPGAEHEGVALDAGAPRFATIALDRRSLGSGLDHRPNRWVIQDDEVRVIASTVSDVVAARGRGPLPAEIARRARREVIEMVSTLLDVGAVAADDRPAASAITESCLAVAEELGPMPSSADLAAAVGVTDRWVRAAFRRVYGVSPTTFFRSSALDGVRRELAGAAPGDVTVTDVATRWGFWHLGRFSGLYRSYFGESPAATLRRDP